MENLWWEQIPNANRFVRKIEDSLLEGQSVILKDFAKIPWTYELMYIVTDNVHMENAERSFSSVDAEEIAEEPGEYMLEHYCKEDLRTKFRPGKGYANFLADLETSTLSGSFIRVKNAKGQKAKAWIKFVKEYVERLKGREGAVFLLEIEDAEEISKKKGITVLNYKDEISPYDCFVFNMLAASKLKGSYLQKTYLADLASQLAKTDIELSAVLIEKNEEFLENPAKVLRENAADPSIYKDEEVAKCIRAAQIKLVYPLVEEFRNRFVKKNKRLIEDSLALNNFEGTQTVINDLDEVEIGTISYLSGKYRWPLSYEEIQELQLYKEARNFLAHMRILPYEKIRDIFSRS